MTIKNNDKELNNSIKYITTTLKNSVEELRVNFNKYTVVGKWYLPISSLGDIEKNEILTEKGFKIEVQEKDADKETKKKYKFINGLSADIMSQFKRIGEVCECNEGEKKLESFFLRNQYHSIKNGMTNFNKLYEIKDNEIVKKEKAKKSTTKVEKETNENEEVSLLEKTVSKILELNYFELKPQDIQNNMDLIFKAMLKDNSIEPKQYENYLGSNVGKTDLKIVNQK
jgi:hypothetical protein